MSEKPSNGGKLWVEELGGDELTTRTQTHYPPEEGFRRFLEAHRTGFFWQMLEGQLAECDAVMGENGWHRTAEKPKNFPDDYDADAYSDLWYAGRIGRLCWLVLNGGSRAELAEVNLARILEIGILVSEWDWRGFKPLILRGHKNLKDTTDGARKGGIERGKKLVARKQEIISAMMRLMEKGHSVSSAAAAVARNGIGTSAAANRQMLNREKRRASKISHSPGGVRTRYDIKS